MRLIDAPRVSKHLISQAARARQQTLRLDGPAFPNSRDTTDLSFGDGRASPPLHLSGEGEARRRNEIVNGHENHGVGVHNGVAHGRVTAALRELPNAGGLCGLCASVMGVLALLFIKREI